MGTGEATVFCCVPSCTAARALCSQTSGALLAAAARCAAVLRAASSPYIAVSVRIGCASGVKTIFPVADSMLMGPCRSFPALGDMSTSLPAPPLLAPSDPGAATAKRWFCGLNPKPLARRRCLERHCRWCPVFSFGLHVLSRYEFPVHMHILYLGSLVRTAA